jgi:hypothetical protein
MVVEAFWILLVGQLVTVQSLEEIRNVPQSARPGRSRGVGNDMDDAR